MKYRVVILRQAQKELQAIPSPLFELVEARLLSLGDDPRPPGCKKMKAFEGTWRIRSGNYCVLYEIDDFEKVVTVSRVGHRKEIYR